MSEVFAPIVTQAPPYNPEDAYHVRLWELAGKPSLVEQDSEGKTWGPTITLILQVDGETYLPRELPPPATVTEIEMIQRTVQARLDQREFERTGKRPDPAGAVPRSRAWAAAAMLIAGWSYPSVADLSTPTSAAILAIIYADPESNTTAESTNDQKRKALHYMLVMLAGQQFGERHSEGFGAYERTASAGIHVAIDADDSDWLDLPCGPWASVRLMFKALLK